MIALVDYGMGNRRSVEKALEHVGADVARTADHEEIRRADGIVVPGVGAFPEAMRRLRAAGLDEVIREQAGAGVPVIGLCLGMQLLFTRSAEHEGAEGLGLIPGDVVKLEAPGLTIPHIGWHAVTFERSSPLTAGPRRGGGLLPRALVRPEPEDPADVVGRGDYGGPFVSIVERGNVMGAQFHPEKSSRDGLALLRNFVGLRAAVG